MTSNTKEYMRNYMQFYRWYDKTYKGGMYTLQQKEYMSYYYAEHRHRIINQVRQNRLYIDLKKVYDSEGTLEGHSIRVMTTPKGVKYLVIE